MEGVEWTWGGAVLRVGEMVNTEDEDTWIAQIKGLEKVPRSSLLAEGEERLVEGIAGPLKRSFQPLYNMALLKMPPAGH